MLSPAAMFLRIGLEKSGKALNGEEHPCTMSLLIGAITQVTLFQTLQNLRTLYIWPRLNSVLHHGSHEGCLLNL